MLPFTMEEAWLDRHPDARVGASRAVPARSRPDWKDEALAEKWRKVRQVRRVVTGALEIERAKKVIGSSLEAAPVVHVDRCGAASGARGRRHGRDRHHQRIAVIGRGQAPAGAFALDDVRRRRGRREGRGLAAWRKCARSWRYTADVGSGSAISRMFRRAMPRRCTNCRRLAGFDKPEDRGRNATAGELFSRCALPLTRSVKVNRRNYRRPNCRRISGRIAHWRQGSDLGRWTIERLSRVGLFGHD